MVLDRRDSGLGRPSRFAQLASRAPVVTEARPARIRTGSRAVRGSEVIATPTGQGRSRGQYALGVPPLARPPRLLSRCYRCGSPRTATRGFGSGRRAGSRTVLPEALQAAARMFRRARRQEETEQVTVSVFDLFRIGIGPSSSHTVGPMRAAGRFVTTLADEGLLARTSRVRAELFGSLGATGHGHGSYAAVLWGLEGEDPEKVDTRAGALRARQIQESGRLRLNGSHEVAFDPAEDLVLHRRRPLPFHPNGMTFTASTGQQVLTARTYYSIGGGFVLDDDGSGSPALLPDPTPVPYGFRTAAELLGLCRTHGLRISEL